MLRTQFVAKRYLGGSHVLAIRMRTALRHSDCTVSLTNGLQTDDRNRFFINGVWE
jgi:hypothetical protein